MRRKIFITLSAAVFLLGITKLSFAMMCGSKGHSDKIHLAQAHTEHEHGVKETSEETVLEEAVNAGNKICPVSDEEIDEKTKFTYEYEGKIYNLCCKACMKDFKKDPDKYIKKVEEELKKRAEQEKKAMPAPEMPEGMSEGHHHTESHQEHQH